MRAVRIARFGLEHLGLDDVPEPQPARGEVLIRLRAASLNFRDVLVARGSYNPSYPLPLTLGSDAVGEIAGFGPDAELAGLALGERVCPLLAQGYLDGSPVRSTVRHTLGGPLQGVFADYVTARADSVVKIPDVLDDLAAASLPCAGVTAFNALCVQGTLAAGQTLLVLGSGGVSVFGIQLGKALGARVFATTRMPAKRARLLELGADEVLEIAGPGWGKRVRDLASGEGVDHVLDVGGGGTLAESLAAVRPGGTISLIGVLSAAESALAPSLVPLTMREVRLQGIFVGHKRAFEGLVALVVRAGLRPVVDRVVPLERAREAFDHLISGRHVGKVCLSIAD
jgi:NADPH:quinone reductase-like Zn-dependent oxidoreductase